MNLVKRCEPHGDPSGQEWKAQEHQRWLNFSLNSSEVCVSIKLAEFYIAAMLAELLNFSEAWLNFVFR